ncbi:MAG: hypothetical protein J3K34DRAFT_438739 [Monoraphidium minutum]|nr:MAG: hypothetical protein J3K34DRAFT_438739 [Monoraphidium minutum]
MLGVERGLTEKSLGLAPYEHIVGVQVKQAPNKCIEFLRLHTNRSSSVSIGDAKSASPMRDATINKPEGFLAAIRGYEDHYPGQAVTKGGLQQLQFVWGVAVCPEPAPVPLPEAPEPVEGPPEPEPLCPPVPEMCDEAAPPGSPATCVAVAPFAAPQCAGGCCVSAGKCKKPLCGKVGLGSEVMAKDMFCWGTNNIGLVNKVNKCKNLACKLAVPGCIGDPISGACVGSVAALTDDVDAGAKQWVGFPCLQPVPGGLAVDALGHFDINGAYAGKLWTICNCKASKSIPSKPCAGPLCELFKKPELPSLNFGLPRFDLPDVGKIINAKKEALGDIAQMFQLPRFGLPQGAGGMASVGAANATGEMALLQGLLKAFNGHADGGA